MVIRAKTLIKRLEKLIEKHGNLVVEIDKSNHFGITGVEKVRVMESDSERGNTIIIE